MDDYEDYRATIGNELTDLVTEKQLIKLHGLLKKNTHIHNRVQASWINMIHEAFYIEDILNNENNTNHSFIKQKWYIFCLIRLWGLRILVINLGCISILVIWSEMTFFSAKPVLSVFAQCVNAARRHYNYFTIEVRLNKIKTIYFYLN
ncbi:unnamed protein product [Rotaria socialis]|uniref:Uncharacterized protein n=1 Tax=Rotaria socialis TaxID=392032 RepID=A0A818I1W4_9BILA|nr:unnamed protein product [Rotaria socialis]CAF4633957.1 unnamed protein product [Rotaria socialis]CAF4741012.1 unnamed protein product [Rotaria socialis]